MIKNFLIKHFNKIWIEYKILKSKYKLNNVKKEDKKIFIFLAADYRNMGDVAITYAQKKFLEDTFVGYKVIEVPADKTLDYIKPIKAIINKDDIVTTIGGGNMGDIYEYYELLRRLVINKMADLLLETNSFISVKDIIDNEDGLEVRLFLFGGYPYRYRNEALYLAPYENAASVADYSEYITFESKVHDLYRVHPHDVKFIGNGGSEGNYYFEGGKLYLGNTSEGVWNVSYYAMPSDITEETPDDYEFEVPKEAHMAIVMKMAYGICVDMGFTTSSFAVFKQEHAQLFNMIEPHDRYRYTKIQNVY